MNGRPKQPHQEYLMSSFNWACWSLGLEDLDLRPWTWRRDQQTEWKEFIKLSWQDCLCFQLVYSVCWDMWCFEFFFPFFSNCYITFLITLAFLKKKKVWIMGVWVVFLGRGILTASVYMSDSAKLSPISATFGVNGLFSPFKSTFPPAKNPDHPFPALSHPFPLLQIVLLPNHLLITQTMIRRRKCHR